MTDSTASGVNPVEGLANYFLVEPDNQYREPGMPDDLAVVVTVNHLATDHPHRGQIQSMWRNVIANGGMSAPGTSSRYMHPQGEDAEGVTVHIGANGISIPRHVTALEADTDQVSAEWRAAAVRRGWVMWVLCTVPVPPGYAGDIVEHLATQETTSGLVGYRRYYVQATEEAARAARHVRPVYPHRSVLDDPLAPQWYEGGEGKKRARVAEMFGMDSRAIKGVDPYS